MDTLDNVFRWYALKAWNSLGLRVFEVKKSSKKVKKLLENLLHFLKGCCIITTLSV